jgi:hypothetical protein
MRIARCSVRMAGFPAIKTLDDYDYSFAMGAPTNMLDELATLRFVERCENAVLLDPSRGGQDPSGYCHWLCRHRIRHQDQVHHCRRSHAATLKPPGARSVTTQP